MQRYGGGGDRKRCGFVGCVRGTLSSLVYVARIYKVVDRLIVLKRRRYRRSIGSQSDVFFLAKKLFPYINVRPSSSFLPISICARFHLG